VSTHAQAEPAPESTPLADAAATAVAAVVEPVWWGAHVREFRWQAELARLLADPVWRGVGLPRGDGTPVLLIPGFLAGDQSLSVMAAWLRKLGYAPRRAGIAFNVRCSDTAVDRLERVLHHVHLSSGRKVAIVGHSRGGHFAKALASRRPEQVAQVISMGSGLDEPFDISEPTRMAVEGVRRLVARRDPERGQQGCFTHTCLCKYSQDYRRPFPESVPLTSLYSKGDGVVRWRACIVPYARCVEVTGSHIGLAFNRHAYREIAHTLAAPQTTA
jgi:pimeloyl-ACP methyl ester carboxylesterase